MIYRKLDADGDMTFGRGRADFWRDQPEGVAQSVATRLALWEGQWFLDPAAGVPYETEVLGRYTEATRDAVLRDHILATQGVLSITRYASQHDRETRGFSVQATIDTVYGSTPNKGPR